MSAFDRAKRGVDDRGRLVVTLDVLRREYRDACRGADAQRRQRAWLALSRFVDGRTEVQHG